MKLFSILVLVNLAAFCGGAQAAKVLALLENLALKETHSMYFKRLTDAGQEVSFKVAEDPSIEIKKDGKNLYDHLVIFSPTVEELRGSLSGEDIGEFIHDGGNLLIAGSSRGGDMITDHENLRVLDILTGCSFSRLKPKPITEYPHVTGKNAELSAGLQARNNGRVIFSGSMDLFSDEKFSSLVEKAGSGAHGVPSGNEDIDKALSAWCFQMAGVVRIDSVQHHLASSSMKKEKPSIIIAHFGYVIAFASLCFLIATLERARQANQLSNFIWFSLPWILWFSWVGSALFFSLLIDTPNIPVPKLVLLGAILIVSGFLLLLPGPSSPRPLVPFQRSTTTLIATTLIGAGIGTSGIAAACSATGYLDPKYLNFLTFFDFVVGAVLGIVSSNTFDKAILLLIKMEVVAMLLAIIFLI